MKSSIVKLFNFDFDDYLDPSKLLILKKNYQYLSVELIRRYLRISGAFTASAVSHFAIYL